jgi:hypothetical protein
LPPQHQPSWLFRPLLARGAGSGNSGNVGASALAGGLHLDVTKFLSFKALTLFIGVFACGFVLFTQISFNSCVQIIGVCGFILFK